MKLIRGCQIITLFFLRLMPAIVGTTVQYCPSICRCQHSQMAAWCSRIPSNFTNFTTTLKELHLNNTKLGPRFSHIFTDMPMLEVLDLSRNGIYLLQDQILHKLTNLKVLNLQKNLVSTLTPTFFETTRKLEYLDLSHNKFAALPDHTIKYLENLKILNISYNILISPSLMVRFQQTTKLQILDYSGNNFQHFPVDSFIFSDQWDRNIGRHVNLSNCGIKHIHPNVFEKFPNLVSLSLSGNPLIAKENLTLLLSNLQNLTTLKSLDLSFLNYKGIITAFENLQQITIEELDLSGNQIEEVPEVSLQYLSTLKRFRINRNKLTATNGLNRLSNLQYLDVSYNQISKWMKDFTKKLFKLEYFIAHHNMLHAVTVKELSEWKRLRHLDISHNSLETLNIPLMVNLETLNVSNNKLRSLLFPVGIMMLRTIDASNNKLTSMVSFQFSGMKYIHTVNYSNNDLTMIHGQTFKGYTPKKIDLSGNKLTKLGHYGWENATEVYLRRNLMKEVGKQAFYRMFSLKILDLRYNNIKTIIPGTFRHLMNLTTLLLSSNKFGSNTDFENVFDFLFDLQHLDLSSNALSAFNNASLKRSPLLKSISLSTNNLTSLSPVMFSETVKLECVDLSDNPYTCDCSLVPLRDWLRRTTVQVYKNKNESAYACTSPPWRTGIAIWKFEVEKFECERTLLYLTIFGSVTLFVLAVVAVLAMSSYIREKCYRWRISRDFKTFNHCTVDLIQSKDQINPLLNGSLKKKTQTPRRMEERPKQKAETQKQQKSTTATITAPPPPTTTAVPTTTTTVPTITTVAAEAVTKTGQANREIEKENIYVNCLEYQQLRQSMYAKPSRCSMTPDPSYEHRYNPIGRRHSMPGNASHGHMYPWQYRNNNNNPKSYGTLERSNTMREYKNYNVPASDYPYRNGLYAATTGTTRRHHYPTDSCPDRYTRNVSDSVLVHRPYWSYHLPQPQQPRGHAYPYYPHQHMNDRRPGGSHRAYVSIPTKKISVAQWL